MFYSPLRYPGGKNKISPFLAKICIDNKISGHYVEPFCGGAAVALFLLFEGYVERITINDKDRSIYSFWHSILNHPKQLCKLIRETPITIEEWHKQFEIQKNKHKENLLTLGFSTFFLNRTNRSGIINARPIGGLEQKSDYKIDSRFNKESLIERIKLIASKKKNIRLYKKDAIKLIAKVQKESYASNTIFYFDPPYFIKGSSLYLNHYDLSDHQLLSSEIKKIKTIRWIVSYDNVPEIRELYKSFYSNEYELRHTSNKPKNGKEILFLSENIVRPNINNWDPSKFKFKKRKTADNIRYHRISTPSS